MSGKKTILIAVFVNAALVAVLFMTTLVRSETALPSSPLDVEPMSLSQNSEVPLFKEGIDVAMRKAEPPVMDSSPSLAQLVKPPVAEQPPVEIVHKLPPQQVVQETNSPSAASREVQVKKGDSLEKIAKAQGVTVDQIIQANHLPSSLLRVGQVLKIPDAKTKMSEVKALEPSAHYYTVKVGDNPWSIAMKHHIKVEELLRLNGLNEERARKLKPGDRLKVH